MQTNSNSTDNIAVSYNSIRYIKRTTKTIDKYDEFNKYLGREVIVEDVEDIQLPANTLLAQPAPTLLKS